MSKTGRPPKHGEAMTGAERTREWRERKQANESRQERRRRFQRQQLRWLRQSNKRDRLAEIEGTLKQHPKVMREYLTALFEHRTMLRLAIQAAKRDLFSPESVHKITKEHALTAELLADLDEVLRRKAAAV